LPMGSEGTLESLVVDTGDEEVGIFGVEPEQLVANRAADEVRVEAEAAHEVLDCSVHLLDCDCFDLDEKPRRQP
jgi:hypothetical protein